MIPIPNITILSSLTRQRAFIKLSSLIRSRLSRQQPTGDIVSRTRGCIITTIGMIGIATPTSMDVGVVTFAKGGDMGGTTSRSCITIMVGGRNRMCIVFTVHGIMIAPNRSQGNSTASIVVARLIEWLYQLRRMGC